MINSCLVTSRAGRFLSEIIRNGGSVGEAPNGSHGQWNLWKEKLFYLLIISILLVSFPRFLALLLQLSSRLIGDEIISFPKASDLPRTPGDLGLYLLFFLGTLFLRPKTQTICLVVLSVPIGLFISKQLDFLSLGILGFFSVMTFGIIKVRWRKAITIPILCGMSLGFMVLCAFFPGADSKAIHNVALFQMTLLPSLWYSAYEEIPPKKHLRFIEFSVYLYMRFFMVPVATYREIFSEVEKNIGEVRFAGIKALYVALFATYTIWGIDSLMRRLDSSELTGFSLLFVSYLFYVRSSCTVVIVFDMVTGILRLFGIPIRNSFDYWLLARTPNEHWRRWNILFREWVITFIFFPIMRARRWLFVAVMAALMTSGVLHVIPMIISEGLNSYKLTMNLVYWAMNGLAIYIVIKVPSIYPSQVKRLGIGKSRIWNWIGIVLTSVFYAVLNYARGNVGSWNDLLNYLDRLTD